MHILSQLEQASFRLLECCCLIISRSCPIHCPSAQARKLRAELQKKGVSAPAATSAPAAAAADTTAAAVAAAVTAALKAAPVAAVAPAPAPAASVPATSARSTFNPADLDRYAELQQKTREMQGLQVGAGGGGDEMQLGAAVAASAPSVLLPRS